MTYIFENVAVALALILFGYVMGSIPSGVIIGRLFFKKDPRDYGSHNSGGTNSGRVFGKKIGALVIVLDFLKAAIAFWVSYCLLFLTPLHDPDRLFHNGIVYLWLVPLFAVIGHCWSLFLRFKGGKAVSCYMALVGGTSYLGAIMCIVSYLVPLKLRKVVSLSSIVAGGILCLFHWVMAIIVLTSGNDLGFLMWTFDLSPSGVYFGYEAASVVTISYMILVWRHRENILRLKNGTESKITWIGK